MKNKLRNLKFTFRNTESPRRKMILRCTYDSGVVNKQPAKIMAYTLNTDFKTQAISRMISVAPVECMQHDLVGMYGSIRKLYHSELLERKASGRKKVAAFSHEFTPDITIWCSKTYPKNNMNRPRLEAYVCYPADPDRSDSGYLERGRVIEETKKHTTKIEDNNVSKWLESEFPFSIVHPRRSSKKTTDLETYSKKTEVNIREEIIAHLAPYLEGNNIALKTFWYLYPNLKHCYSAENYTLLGKMVCAEIGFWRVADFFIPKEVSSQTHKIARYSDTERERATVTGVDYAAFTISKSRIFVISLISSRFRFSSSMHRCCTPFSS